MKLSLSILGLTLSLTACSNTESEDIKTQGMSAVMNVSDDGERTSVDVELYAGTLGLGGSYIELGGGDQLTATYQAAQPLQKHQNQFNQISYETQFPGSHGGETFTISLDRKDGIKAPSSIVTLPPAFTVEPAVIAGDLLTLKWTSVTKQDLNFGIQVICGEERTSSSKWVVIRDSGSHQIRLSDLRRELKVTGNCEGTVELNRTAKGQLDSAFGKGGEITGRQIRKQPIQF